MIRREYICIVRHMRKVLARLRGDLPTTPFQLRLAFAKMPPHCGQIQSPLPGLQPHNNLAFIYRSGKAVVIAEDAPLFCALGQEMTKKV